MSDALAPHDPEDVLTQGSRLSDHLLACTVPKLANKGTGFAKLTICLNGDLNKRSQSFFLLRITDKCPPGYSCEGGEVHECAPGHKCLPEYIHQPQRRCPLGYYQDIPGSSFCQPCPRGFICPFPAMQAPLPCPPGFLCD